MMDVAERASGPTGRLGFLMLGSVIGAPLSLAIAGVLVDIDATALFVGAGCLVLVTALAGFATSLPRRMV